MRSRSQWHITVLSRPKWPRIGVIFLLSFTAFCVWISSVDQAGIWMYNRVRVFVVWVSIHGQDSRVEGGGAERDVHQMPLNSSSSMLDTSSSMLSRSGGQKPRRTPQCMQAAIRSISPMTKAAIAGHDWQSMTKRKDDDDVNSHQALVECSLAMTTDCRATSHSAIHGHVQSMRTLADD